MNITELIVELLQQGQKVELPGIGTFDSVVQEPHHDPVTRIYYPATRSIVFDRAVSGDESIVKEIAHRDCVSDDVARQMWHNYIDALTDKLQRTGEHRLGELGSITKVGGGYGFDKAEGVVIEAGNSNETPLEEVRTYDHSDSDDNQRDGIVVRCFWMNDLFDGFHERSNTRIQHDHGNDHGAQIFDASVSKGMLFIRLLACKLCADDGDQGTSCIRDIVYRVKDDGNRVGRKTDHSLEAGKEYIGYDPYNAGSDNHFFAG